MKWIKSCWPGPLDLDHVYWVCVPWLSWNSSVMTSVQIQTLLQRPNSDESIQYALNLLNSPFSTLQHVNTGNVLADAINEARAASDTYNTQVRSWMNSTLLMSSTPWPRAASCISSKYRQSHPRNACKGKGATYSCAGIVISSALPLGWADKSFWGIRLVYRSRQLRTYSSRRDRNTAPKS